METSQLNYRHGDNLTNILFREKIWWNLHSDIQTVCVSDGSDCQGGVQLKVEPVMALVVNKLPPLQSANKS